MPIIVTIHYCGNGVNIAGGHPMKYDALTVMEDIVATQTSRLEIDVPGDGGRGGARTASAGEGADDPNLDEQWRQDIASGARHLREESYVRVSEPHYDAKVWPVEHPYGTGSMLAEPGAGSAHRHAKNRLVLIQSWFRKTRSGRSGFSIGSSPRNCFSPTRSGRKDTCFHHSHLFTCDNVSCPSCNQHSFLQ